MALANSDAKTMKNITKSIAFDALLIALLLSPVVIVLTFAIDFTK